MSNFDLSVDNYTSEELYRIIKTNNDCETYEISININKIIKDLKESSQEYSYVVFLKDIETRLINERKEMETNELLQGYVTRLKEVEKIHETYVNKYPKGTINPIEKKTLTQVINIDSLFRSNYDNTDASDFIYTLANPINNVISIRLSSLEIPSIWYSFSNERSNNKFTITVYNIPDIAENKNLDDTQKYVNNQSNEMQNLDEIKKKNIQHTITIPEGNYTTEEFQENINNYFLNKGNGLQCLKFEINEYTGKVNMRCKNKLDFDNDDDGNEVIDIYDSNNKYYSNNFYYILDFGINQNKNNVMEENCGWTMGFRKDIYTITKNNILDDTFSKYPSVTYYNYIESEGAYGTSLNNYFFLSLDDYNKNFKNSIIAEQNNSIIGSTFIARIPISVPSNSIMNDNGSDRIFKIREYFGPVKIERLRIQIIDKYGKKINLNKNDFSFTIECTQLY
tara:strand:+ start:208 stop:1563 length:1356 start_codon:yes stop_codon:yes gene_type:complete